MWKVSQKKGTTDQIKKEKLSRNKILCRSGSGDKARSSFWCRQGECGGRRSRREAKETILFLGGLWGGGTSSTPDLKTIKRRVWSAWEVRGGLNVVELWLFEFDNAKEAKRILRGGTRKLWGFSIFLKKWTKEDGCISEKNFKEAAWVKLIGLPIQLWSRPILRRIGDRCSGFLAMDEDTTFLSDLHWARIQVKWNGKSLP